MGQYESFKKWEKQKLSKTYLLQMYFENTYIFVIWLLAIRFGLNIL